MNEYGFNTGLLHGTNEKYPQGATQVPIYQSSAFRHDSAEDLEKIFDNKKMGFSYTRINNPTVESFEKRVTMLEDGIGSVACASGMAALTNAFLNILQAGDEIVAACGLYGGTVELFDDLKPFGRISRKLLRQRSQRRRDLFLRRSLATPSWMLPISRQLRKWHISMTYR